MNENPQAELLVIFLLLTPITAWFFYTDQIITGIILAIFTVGILIKGAVTG